MAVYLRLLQGRESVDRPGQEEKEGLAAQGPRTLWQAGPLGKHL